MFDDLQFTCRKIFLREFTLDCNIGVYDHEKGKTQKVVFDCDVWVPLDQTPSEADNLANVLDYDSIVSAISKIALSRHFELQESLVDQAADEIASLPGVVLVRLSSQKIEAYPNIKGVGIEVYRKVQNSSQ